jgi:hypothetical protein
VFLSVSSFAAAQNLIPDPTFSSGISAWSVREPPTGTTLQWIDAPGADGTPGYATMAPLLGLVSSFARTCIPVEAGVTYSWGGFLRLDAAAGASSARIDVFFYSDSSCESIFPLSASTSPPISTPLAAPGWYLRQGPDVTAPAEAVSVAFEVVLISSLNVAGRVDFDNVFFGRQGLGPPSAIVPVPMISSLALAVLAASLAAVGVLALRR